MKFFIYIAQARRENSFCKIGITADLEERLKSYNSETGRSADNLWEYLFTCETDNAEQVEDDIKQKFSRLREKKKKEVYFYNDDLLEDYVNFIKSHELFVREIFVKTEDLNQITKVVKKSTPSLDERGLGHIDLLNRAKKAQNDEFYTRYEDIEKEIAMYDKNIWEDKTVFCSCDDAVGDKDTNSSAFTLYFIRNFEELNLKKLICTHYGGGQPRAALHACPLFVGTLNDKLVIQGINGYIFTKNGYEEIGKKESPKGYSGSFDDPISIKILNEEADIVCTNPPFSKSIEYWQTLIESGKKFLIISNVRIAIHSRYLPYFKNGLAWPGYNRVDWFLNPKWQATDTSAHWFTNLPVVDRPKYRLLKIIPLKKIPKEYKYYDDSKVLVVKKGYIPSDYKKPFAVSARPIANGLLEKGYEIADTKEYIPCINGKKQFSMALVQLQTNILSTEQEQQTAPCNDNTTK